MMMSPFVLGLPPFLKPPWKGPSPNFPAGDFSVCDVDDSVLQIFGCQIMDYDFAAFPELMGETVCDRHQVLKYDVLF
jgi:hypothetical protein